MKRTRLRPVSKKSRTRWDGLKALRSHVQLRARGRCEACRSSWGKDAHHVVKRSAGGPDHPGNLIWLCRSCHQQTDEAYHKGRLIITALGGERFRVQLLYAADKWAARQ